MDCEERQFFTERTDNKHHMILYLVFFLLFVCLVSVLWLVVSCTCATVLLCWQGPQIRTPKTIIV